MKKITKRVILKGIKQDKQQALDKWEALKRLIKETDLIISKETKSELYVSISGVSNAYIEVVQDDGIFGFTIIKLWHYEFKSEPINKKHNQRKSYEYQTLFDALNYINSIITDINIDKSVKRA